MAATVLEAPPAPPAAYATARTPGNKTLGGRVAVISNALGAPLMPWQRQVADVAMELHPHKPGAWRYPVVVVTVPRQAGKTTLLRAVAVDRAVTKARQLVFFTAQTGKDARARWKDIVDAVGASPLAPHAQVRRAQGSEALTFPNRSEVAPFAPTPKSLHGYTPPLVLVDEGWAFDAGQGEDLTAAIEPAQVTLVDRQLWIVSTQGTADSAWFNALVDRGRLATGDPGAEIAYFEWSADPALAAADPYGDETLSFHPALGHTITLDTLRSMAGTTSPGNWWRSFLNLRSTSAETVMDLTAWDALARPRLEVPAGDQVTIGYAVAADRSGGTVQASWVDAEGRPHLALVATKAGAAWVPGVVAELHRTLAPRMICADDSGLTRNATAELGRLGVPVRTLSVRDYTSACGDILGRVKDATMSHDDAPETRDAIEAAVLRPMGGAQGFNAQASRGPIDALQAGACALWMAQTETTPTVQIF